MDKQSLKNPTRRYITGLDGIRAIAVIAVIIYHLLPFSIQGGYLGVSIFFSVSGYLITDLLVQEWDRTGSIDLKKFYYRRLKRLYPALVTMVVTTGAYITLFQRNLIDHLGVTVWTNLLYVYNWWEISHGQSYFDRFNGESPFTHLWSLSIEAQYYLIWPLLLMALLIILKSKLKIYYCLIVLACLFSLWMTIVYHTVNNINRVYYGTDTRIFSILFGAALALFWQSNKLKPHLNWAFKIILNLIGISSLIGIGFLLFTLSGQNPATYNWGMLAITVLTTLLIATCVHPGASINALLTNSVFKWIGTRSYGIYLYQFPVMIFYEARVISISDHPFLNALVEIGLILIISELSYRFIEHPLRNFDFKLLRANTIEFFSANSKFGMKRLFSIPIIILFLICGYGTFNDKDNTHADSNNLQADISQNQKIVKEKNQRLLEKQAAERRKAARQSSIINAKLTDKDKQTAATYHLNGMQVLKAKSFSLTAIGDSVMADCAGDLQNVFPNAYISAQVGRQIWQAPDVINQLKASSGLAPNVLLNLGTNSPITFEQIKAVIDAIGPDHQIYWINVHVPTRYWEGQVNDVINMAARKYKNFHVIDWHRLSENQNQLFWDDHVHPNPDGNNKYVSLIAKTIFK